MATVASNISRVYKDLDLNFNIHPIKKDINKHTAERAVINSIKNLMLTNFYERPFRPNLGSNVRSLLFEPLDSGTASLLEIAIRDVIKNYEPRARINRLYVEADFENNGFKTEMEFFVLNLTTPLTINFFLERAR